MSTSDVMNTTDREIVAKRVFDAPREMVWQAWTDPNQISRWWGPNGFTTTTSEMDVRPGGRWLHVMHGPDGRDYPNEILYAEVARPERLVYDHGPAPRFRVTVTFAERAGKTEVSVRMVFESAALRDEVAKAYGAVEGLHQTLSRLADHLKTTERALVITRVFDAPRERVFKAWTEPEQLMRWFAPKNWTTPFCTVDLRPGGIFHFCMRSPEGQNTWGRGVYREIVKPERIVYVDSFADEKGNPVEPTRYGASASFPSETLVTITFSEEDGKTRVTLRHDVAESVPERSGMQQGWNEMFERLAELMS